ncbi:MAG: molybdopterin cofactor-binding domain-containing protein [Chitinophagales bacterium]
MAKNKWTRRAFISMGGLAGLGLIVGVGGNAYVNKAIKEYNSVGMGLGNSLNAFVRIAPDNRVTLSVARAEMGQGVLTAVSQLIAEELEIPMESINVAHPQPASPYANTFVVTQEQPNIFKGYSMSEKLYAFLPIIATGGSTTISDAWNNMRYAGATAREMLKAAAAQEWGIAASELKAENGYITDGKVKQSYGELAEAAAKIQLPELPKLKERSAYKLIGKPVKRLDIPEKTNGTAIYGLDIRLEGMLYGAVRHPSVVGGTITKITNQAKVEKMSGIKKVFLSQFNKAVVVATNTWQAMQGAKALRFEENDNGFGNLTSAQIMGDFTALLDEEPIKVKTNIGDAPIALAQKGIKNLEALYQVPYLAHAAMEPMNCTVLVKAGRCEAWVGHQATSIAQNMLNEVTGIAKKNIQVNIQHLGGGFGRRSEPDFVRVAADIAQEMEGTPIQVVYSREEDMKNSPYRPCAVSRFKGAIAGKKVVAWDNMTVGQSPGQEAILRIMPAMAPSPKDDDAMTEGAHHLPYDFPNYRVAFGHKSFPIPVGFWRSVGNSQNVFFAESFMDEMAHAAGQDPMKFRRSQMGDRKRFTAVLDKVAEMSKWNEPLPENHFRGVAIAKSFGSIVAEVAVIEKKEEKTFKIKDFYCVIDCGNTVNPDTIEAQMEGGIVYGLTAALYGEISISDGGVDQLNFPQYEMVRMQVCPQVKVAIMDVDEYPGGVGEPGLPPAAPALTNAIFAATGERIRTLPLTKQGYTFV